MAVAVVSLTVLRKEEQQVVAPALTCSCKAGGLAAGGLAGLIDD